MPSTNKTEGFALSQFLADDRPTFLGDYNADMAKIDSTLTMQTANVNTALATANNAAGDVATAISTAQGFDNRVNNLEQIVPNIQANVTTAFTAADNVVAGDSLSRDSALSDRITINDNKFASYYTKVESDAIYQRNVDSRARVVVIGDNDSIPGNTWVDMVAADRDWVVYNFATAGTGFSMGGDNTYSSQLSKAVADTRFVNDNISLVIVASCYNDVMANFNVTSLSEALFGQASRSFPNARVIVLPLFWRHFYGSAYTYANQFSKLRRINELRETSRTAQVDFVQYSYTWFEGADTNSSNVIQESYYENIVTWFNRYLNGSGTANDKTATLTGGSQFVPTDTSDRFGAHVSRRGDICYLHGALSTVGGNQSYARGDKLASLPVGFQPAMVTDTVSSIGGNGGAMALYVTSDGLYAGQAGTNIQQIILGGTYRIG